MRLRPLAPTALRSEGPRNCVGQSLAKMEVMTLLAKLLASFQIELAPEMGGRDGIRARESTHLTLQTAGTKGIRWVSPLGLGRNSSRASTPSLKAGRQRSLPSPACQRPAQQPPWPHSPLPRCPLHPRSELVGQAA